jgi:putative ABC transport system permease protein
MFQNYLITALRNFSRHKLYSFINIAGLTVGLACAIFIILLVRDELSYDKWIPNIQNVYRIQGLWPSPGNASANIAASPAPFPVADAMLAEIPEVKAAAHLEHYRMTVATENRQFIDAVDVVSPNFFQIIQLPLVQGNPARVFAQPESVVISQSAARKYFGSTPAMGKTLHVVGGCNTGPEDNGCVPHEGTLMVTGVMRDLPHNTQLTGDVFFPNSSTADPMTQSRKRAWLRASGFGYVELQPDANLAHVKAELVALIDRDSDPKKIAGLNMTGSQYWMPTLGSFRDDHLSRYEDDGLTPAGSWTMVTGFAAIGVLILLVACFNFTNLATAQAMVRAKEISLRKVLGARRGQVAAQFLGESVLTALISLVLALSLTELLFSAFGRMVGKPIALHYLGDWPLTLGLVALAVLTGLIAGAYPALILSGFRPVSALRTSGAAAQGSGLVRTALVVLQFAVSIGLGIAALVVFEQTNFARSLSLGLDKDGVVVVAADSMTQGTRQSFIRALNADPVLKGAALSGDTPFTDGAVGAPVQMPGQTDIMQIRVHMIGPDFLSVYRIRLLAGRALSESRLLDIATGSTDTAWNVLINRTAAKQYFHSPDDALGKTFDIVYPANKAAPRQHLTIVGVTDDFKYSGGDGTVAGGLSNVVPTFYFDAPQNTNTVSVRVPANGVARALSAIDRIWHGFAPSVAIDRHFLDQDFQNLFAAQEKQERVFPFFVLVAIAIASMGLFGMAALSTERRTKEVGLRKTFGARTRDIVLLLLWQFSIPVLVANVIAWPVAYFYLRHWLDGYAYRISLNPLYFVGAGVAALIIAWATVIVHAAHVARANPIHALRYE